MTDLTGAPRPLSARDHQEAWEAVAEHVGRAALTGRGIAPMLDGERAVVPLAMVAELLALARTRTIAHLDRAVDQAVTDRAEGNIMRIAEPGHLRCLREGRDSVVKALRDVRAKVIGART